MQYKYSKETVSSPHVDRFRALYGTDPEFEASAPGRVNLIGEHIDYMDYGVFPFAIERKIRMLFRVTGQSVIKINHVEPQYPSASIPVDPSAKIQFVDNYVKYFTAGYRAGSSGVPAQELKGLEVLVSGDVPVAAGVSSSSALTVCASIMTSFANNRLKDLKFDEYLERIIQAERGVGLSGGGMDQSTSLMGKQGKAVYIEFNPIRIHQVTLPKGYVFVVANSLTPSPKIQTAAFRYNKRVCQCKIAIAILAKATGVSPPPKTMRVLQQLLKATLAQMVQLVEKHIPNKQLQLPAIEELTGLKIQTVLQSVPTRELVLQKNKTFQAYNAAKHVFLEAGRVLAFKAVCEGDLPDSLKAMKLGKLMDESHFSCDWLYNCSCPELNVLNTIAREEGALGSRLTGAGWGGCSVILVAESEEDSLMAKLQERYYKRRGLAVTGDVVFRSCPSEGASIHKVSR